MEKHSHFLFNFSCSPKSQNFSFSFISTYRENIFSPKSGFPKKKKLFFLRNSTFSKNSGKSSLHSRNPKFFKIHPKSRIFQYQPQSQIQNFSKSISGLGFGRDRWDLNPECRPLLMPRFGKSYG